MMLLHGSNYADWDVKARLPHGVEAIKKHLKEVDNVPLLVSLYTGTVIPVRYVTVMSTVLLKHVLFTLDSKPSTVRQMIEIFRSHGEVVMTVGSGHRTCNYDLFAASDVAVSVATLPGDMTIPQTLKDVVSKFPPFSINSICRADLILSFRFIGLMSIPLLQNCCIPTTQYSGGINNNNHKISRANLHMSECGGSRPPWLQGMMGEGVTQGPKDSSGDKAAVTGDTLELMSLLEGVRVGRILVNNAFQAVALLLVSVVALASHVILTQLIPLSIPPLIPLPLILLLMCIYLPTILFTVLFGPAHDHIMSDTPRKNMLLRKWRDESRFLQLLIIRAGYAASSVALVGLVTTASLAANNPLCTVSDRFKWYFTVVVNGSYLKYVINVTKIL